ncbi:hypothetical protein FB566_1714 [Stackebrandtia endophytica]|uniref:Uncharacterized protein n=1 Tax=Stackebrandtia endophytica TaxID=1496996 RepID=A0A543AUD7_9ACTN|nr:hypothetical protein [Stackebrandtia endophytica]TQL76192.1 hypothetical protein FB566_1714 [Stackebrandtia endophytica]
MLDQAAIAVATGAAGNAIAYLLSGRIDALRTKLTHLFRWKNTKERATVLGILDDDALALQRQTTSEADLKAKWTAIFMEQLFTCPEIREDLRSFATAAPEKAVHIGSQNNYGSGVFVGGDNHGGINLPAHEEGQ